MNLHENKPGPFVQLLISRLQSSDGESVSCSLFRDKLASKFRLNLGLGWAQEATALSVQKVRSYSLSLAITLTIFQSEFVKRIWPNHVRAFSPRVHLISA